MLLVFHGLTLMVQELPEDRASADNNWLLPHIPMTPGERKILYSIPMWAGSTSRLYFYELFKSLSKGLSLVKIFSLKSWFKFPSSIAHSFFPFPGPLHNMLAMDCCYPAQVFSRRIFPLVNLFLTLMPGRINPLYFFWWVYQGRETWCLGKIG